ncbi:transcription factor Adf-1-like [Vespula squamosa]|uniref:Transcription factor Adf-1-like n=1 Tax=Vespula squamosa TaxID=30214 RepID=A0ABD2BSG8_VESSQ
MCETERLIDLVKNYPILYNMKNKYYKDINKKATVWKEIAIQLDLEDGIVAKNKWRHLRDCYGKYLRSQSDATGQYNKKYRRWTWANQMDFLKPYVTTRQIDLNHVGSYSDSDTDTKIKSEPAGHEDIVQYFNDSHNEEMPVSKHCSIQPTLNLNIPEETIEYLQTRKVQKCMDAVDLLFLSYAQTLKTFSPQRQIAIKLQIAQIINSAEIAQLGERDRLRFPTSPSSPT